jgi:capsular exopolysaccharide synthesis family protein
MGRITSGVKLAKDTVKESPKDQLATGPSKIVNALDIDASARRPVRRVDLDSGRLARNRIVTLDSENPAKAAYKMLRTRLLRRMQAHGWGSFAVTSVSQGDGKTMTALNLSISIAGQPENSVILVDLDLRKPSIYRYLGLEAYPGLNGWLEGSSTLNEVLVYPGIEGLYVLPNDITFDDSSERLQSQRMRELIDELKGQYPTSMLVFDMPPLLEADDALAFSPFVDALLLVVAQGETDRARLAQTKEMLEDGKLLGVVLNKSDEASSGYY